MDFSRTQIRRILEYHTELAKRDFEERRKAIYADHSARGMLKSGATIRRVIRLMEELGAAFVSDTVEKVSVVAQNLDAFADLTAAFEDFWRFLETELAETINLASGRQKFDWQEDSVSRAAEQLFSKSHSLVRSKLELYRFTFTKPVAMNPLELPEQSAPPNSKVRPEKTGGRPLAEHWDDMWAAIAVALYTGDLNPKSQADVERAMTGFLEGQGRDPATSTVRQRARRLWDRLAEEN